MSAQEPSEGQLLDDAIEILRRRLPPNWTLEKTALGGDPAPQDLIIRGPSASSQTIFVEARVDVSTRDVSVLMGGPWRRLRKQSGNQPLILIAPYISPRVRELLTEENVSYLDLTGNVRVSLEYPAVFIATEGAERAPSAPKPRRGLKGAKVGAVVRVLVDATPPYAGSEIAKAAGVNEGYVSRILEALSDEGVIEKERFGRVTGVDWPGMLRRRARELDLFRPAGTYRYVARQGTRSLLDELGDRSSTPPPTITGSFAAARLAPIAAPNLLVVYTQAPRELAEGLSLLPAETGADTILVRPDNDIVFAGSSEDQGAWWVAPSQVAIDCLAGSGRMPAEGEAVIEWMRQDESRWRYESIQALIDASNLRGANDG